MIAHAPRTPRVVPFFHTGMQNLVAEDPATKDVLPVGGLVGWLVKSKFSCERAYDGPDERD